MKLTIHSASVATTWKGEIEPLANATKAFMERSKATPYDVFTVDTEYGWVSFVRKDISMVEFKTDED